MHRMIVIFLLLAVASCRDAGKKDVTAATRDSVIGRDSSVDKPDFFTTYPVLTLLRKTPVDIGCMLETTFGYRDSVFNCSYTNYINKGDPCVNTTAYYEGIVIPAALYTKIHPAIQDIKLDFEHGSLREVTITFRDSLLKDDISKLFHLPADNSSLPDNIMSIDLGDNVYSKDKPVNPAYTRWLTITGFEHMGAGDVDCP